jgi:cytochrome b561
MVPLVNTPLRYGTLAVALHWLMALLLVALIGLGLYMVALPDAGFDTRKVVLILYHKQLGMLALALAALRWLWRLANPLPALAPGLPAWQMLAARLAHLVFYALMLALPLSGWLMSSAAAIPVSFLGLGTLPDLIAPNEARFRELIVVHRWAAWGLGALALVHAGAALRHHFVLRDDTLRKMWWSDAA